MTQAFELNKKVQEKAEEDPAFRKEYLELSDRCKRFATDLHDSFKNIGEFVALLGIDWETEPQLQPVLNEKKMGKQERRDVAKQLRRAVDSKHLEVRACT